MGRGKGEEGEETSEGPLCKEIRRAEIQDSYARASPCSKWHKLHSASTVTGMIMNPHRDKTQP